ncbi:MFS transporter [Antarcticirhabdus aurantiaca]|uniref:MFS transporter n=1 Tax=Antarcticirhabdus aurantiaca TaxID=2606717 RepID=A0ACD4NNX9_9HYPH|nr:MFS transporter [Antarcticirhabdus aurantiaca]WAJ28493.1 MFS transporter [Jeongeuplla avenae]
MARALALTLPGSAAAVPLLAIGGIAAGQSLLGALTFQGVPTLMRASGVSLDIVALTYLAMLPWTLKILWAPIVERHRLPATGGRRTRAIVLACQAVVVCTLALLALAGPSVPAVVIALLALAATASATLDVAGDGFAVEQAGPHGRQRTSAVQIGGAYLGMVAGAGGLLLAAPFLGWTGSLLTIAGLIAALTLPVLRIEEAPLPVTCAKTRRPSLSRAFGSRPVRSGLVAVLLFQAGPRIAQALVGPSLVESGLDPVRVGLIVIAGSAFALPATLLAGGIGERLSSSRLLLAALLQALALTGLVCATAIGSVPALVAGVLLFSAVNAFGFVALYALLMGAASPDQAGVDFTLFQSADAFVALSCGLLGGVLTSWFGYSAGFALALAGAAAALAVLPLVTRPLAHLGASR